MATNEVPKTGGSPGSQNIDTYKGKTEKEWVSRIGYDMMNRTINANKNKRVENVKKLLQGYNENL